MNLARSHTLWLTALLLSLACALAAPTAFADGGLPVAPDLEQEAPGGAAGAGDAVLEGLVAEAVQAEPAVDSPEAAVVEQPAAEAAPVVDAPAEQSAPEAAEAPVVMTQPVEVPEEDAPDPVVAPEPDPVSVEDGEPEPAVDEEPSIPAAVPGNVNVSIRILSPGDDGPVQQVSGGGGGGAIDLDWDWHWTWTWSCDPADALTAAAWTWDWNWNWDCGPAAPAPAAERAAPPARQPLGAAPEERLLRTQPVGQPTPGGGQPVRQDASRSGTGEPRSDAPERRRDDALPASEGESGPPGATRGDPPAALTHPAAPAVAAVVGARGAARAPARGDAPDRRPPAPPPPAAPQGPAATAGAGGGGSGSVLFVAALAALLLLAPRPARYALARGRTLKASLGSSRPERPG